MMDFIMVPSVLGVIGYLIYKIFELYVRRRERIMLIEKLSSKEIEGNITMEDINLSSNSYSALKGGCLLAGLGLGLLIGFIIVASVFPDMGNYYYEVRGIVYGSCVLLFGGLGLLAAFVLEIKLSKK